MKKGLILSSKPWLVLSFIVFSMLLLTFSSVNAADVNANSNEFDPWKYTGYKEVTVRNPSRAVPAAAPQEECVLDPNGMVSHWPLDDPFGSTTFLDKIGGINGTCNGGEDTCPARTIGKIGGAYTFAASEGDVVSVPADIPPGKGIYDTMTNGNFSAGVWVKTTQECKTTGLENRVFFGRYRKTPVNGTWWLGCTMPEGEDYSVAVFRLRDSSNNARQIDGISKINDGKWHHIVGVRNAAADENYLYVDGVLEGTLDTPPYIADPTKFSSDDVITMGAYDIPPGYYLDGTLDEVVLYDRVVAGSEISSYYDACVDASTLTYIPLVVQTR